MIIDLSPKPRLRKNVELAPTGDGKFILRDTAGYVDDILVMDRVSAVIVSMLDGTRTPLEIAQYLNTVGGVGVIESDVRKVVETLDSYGFLDSVNFNLLKSSKEAEFRRLSERPLRFAGKSFPADRKEAEEFFQSIIELFSSREKDEDVFAIISPHIEISNGMKIYGLVWSFLRNSMKEPEVFFVFGTSHAYSENPFILTDKDFQTPFGTLKADRELISLLKETLSDRCFEDEILHRSEHSVEFQAVFIKFLFPSSKIVPVLCSSSWIYREDGKKEYDEMLGRIYDVALRKNDGFVLVAGADFAHIGPRFGDSPVSLYDISLTRLKDFISLRKFADNLPDEFLESIMFDGNLRKVCGVAPIYTVLGITKNYTTRGRILGWDIWVDETLSAVSFGAAFLSRKDRQIKDVGHL